MSDALLNTQDDLLDNLLSDFLDESDQLLTQLNDNLLQIDEWVQALEEGQDQHCDADLLNEMFRAAHSIKGLSAMLGLDEINTLTHKIENVFDAARNDQLYVNADVVDLVFMGLDRLTALVERLKDPDTDPVDCETVLEGIRELLRSAGAEREKTSQADAERALAAGMAEVTAASVPCPPDPFQDVQDESEITETYLSIFIDEADIALDELSATLMALEDNACSDPTELRRLLGTAHKIKGSAASIGLNRAAKLAHLMEDQLEDIVQQSGSLTPELTDGFLACVSALQQYVTDLRSGSADTEHFAAAARQLLPNTSEALPTTVVATLSLTDRLEGVLTEIQTRLDGTDLKEIGAAAGVSPATVKRVCSGGNVKLDSVRSLASYLDEQSAQTAAAEMPTPDQCADAGPVPSVDVDSTASASPQIPPNADDEDSEPLFVGHVAFEPNLALAGLKAHLIHEKLASLGEMIECTPPAEQLSDLDDLKEFSFRLRSEEPIEAIEAQCRLGGVQKATIEHQGKPAEPEDSTTGQADGTTATSDGSRDATASSPGAPTAASGGATTSTQEPATSGSAAPKPTAAPENSNKASAAPAAARPAKARGSENTQRPAETVRVDIDRLDQLMDLAGQLVINKAQFGQIGDKLRSVLNCKQSLQALDRVTAELSKIENSELRIDAAHKNDDLQQLQGQMRRIQTFLEPVQEEVRTISKARDFVRDLTEAIHQLERVSDGIQQGVMDTRMVPVGPLFTRFKRVVRDITRANGKQVQLVIHGEKTELDKRMIDELGDPLVHMVRNSADHGVELPDEREAAGKPRLGTVTLDACHRGNSILIRVSDDGKGLDTDRILKKCLEKGVLTPADAEKMTPHQIHQMIWEPGLSTAEKVTDVSGRGMGMDIVKSKIEELNGTVEIDSQPGVGTSITIKLPLTLAILPSLMVEIGGDIFAMPMEAVVEIVSVGREHLSTVHGQKTALVRGRVVSLVQLSDALNFHGGTRSADYSDEAVLVILGEPGREIGLVVEHVIGEEDVVIKSIAENYKNIQGIAGASILGDGRVSLILDIAALIDTVSQDQTTAY
jgi:two-component system chemotaxis sensor kinase CheA